MYEVWNSFSYLKCRFFTHLAMLESKQNLLFVKMDVN
jgi:hypothetical protein